MSVAKMSTMCITAVVQSWVQPTTMPNNFLMQCKSLPPCFLSISWY